VRAASAAARAPDRTAADSALGYAQRELALARALRDPSRIARAEDHVGAALAAAGRPAEALAPLARASAGYTRLGQRAERLANLRVAAEANLALGPAAAAAAVARTAVALADSLDAHEERAEALGVLALASAANGEPAAALAAAWAGRAALDAVYATSRAAAAERTRAAFEVARRQWALDQAEARGVALRAEVARQRTLVWLGALGAALATALLVIVLRAARLARQNAVLVAAQGVQAERLRIARELHDTLLQGFTGVTLQMQVAVEQLGAADAGRATLAPTSVAAAAFERVLGRADAVLAEARSAVWDLRAPGAAEPLPAALAALLDDLAALPTSAAGAPALPVGRLEVVGSPQALGETRERELLRIAREAVANAVRHARARSVTVTLAYEPSAVRLRVRDDGIGCQPDVGVARGGAAHDVAPRRLGHWGIAGMRERAVGIGGTFTVASAVGEGTLVTVHIPLADEAVMDAAVPERRAAPAAVA
jgi:signal transduction histidine kinase